MKKLLFFVLLFISIRVSALEEGIISIEINEEVFVDFENFETIPYVGNVSLYQSDKFLYDTLVDSSFTLENLIFGEYYLIIDEERYTFNVDEACDTAQFVKKLKNQEKIFSFRKENYGLADGFVYSYKRYSNLQIELYTGEDFCDDDCLVLVPKNTLIDTFITDENGEVIISRYLPDGEYYFLVNDRKFEFIVGEELEYVFFYDVLKSDFVIVHHDYFDESLIEGMEIDIYDKENNFLFSRETTNGVLELKDMPIDEYYFIQTKTNDNYELIEEDIFFNVEDERFILKDYPKEVLPDTFKMDYKFILGLGLIILGIFYRRIKCAIFSL